jgi:hypothetical protein
MFDGSCCWPGWGVVDCWRVELWVGDRLEMTIGLKAALYCVGEELESLQWTTGEQL